LAQNRKRTKAAADYGAGIKDFLDMIAPGVLKFNTDHFLCGNTFRCVWALREYPTVTDEQAILRLSGAPSSSVRCPKAVYCLPLKQNVSWK
jgi:hypothetical protein